MNSSCFSFKSSSTGIEYTAKTVIQVCIKPGSYDVESQTTWANLIDPLFNDSELEWATKKYGAISIYGLLVKVTEKKTAVNLVNMT